MAPSVAYVARFILFVGAAVASVRAQPVCSNPSVRREWRALSTDEKAEWIWAVKVRICLSVASRLKIQTLPLVLVDTTPRYQFNRNSAGKRVAHSAHQPGFVIL